MVIRFHLDENVHGAVADALRRRGLDVTTSLEANLVGTTDEEQLAYARAAGRVLVTHDADFLRLHTQGIPHAGLVYGQASQRSLRQIVAVLSRIALTRSAEDMVNGVEFI